MQLVQRYLKDVGIEAELKIQEYGAFIATTGSGKFEGLAMYGYPPGWEPDSILYGAYAPDSLRNTSHVNDPKLTAMLKEQRRTKDLAARKQLIFDVQRYEAEQQYYVYLACPMQTGPISHTSRTMPLTPSRNTAWPLRCCGWSARGTAGSWLGGRVSCLRCT